METELNQLKNDGKVSESGLVTSKQRGIHPGLERCVRKHLESPWKQPFHRPTLEAYKLLEQQETFAAGQPFILDSGCGTGKSTLQLARVFPGHHVIGMDQSRFRLAKSGVTSGILRIENCILIRAELATFWRLLLKSGLSPERHFLFYPNPWPKPGHLSRRWHGHPVFPQLLALGGEIEMRCNWEVYAQEFAKAVSIATGAGVRVNSIEPDDGISPFEQKYLERGQSLFAVIVPSPATRAVRLSRPNK